jgi:hypothetical protein
MGGTVATRRVVILSDGSEAFYFSPIGSGIRVDAPIPLLD